MAANIPFDWTTPIVPSVIVPPPPIIFNPNNSLTESQGLVAYGCFVGILVFILILLVIKIAVKRKRFHARNVLLRQNIARQNQLPTISNSVDGNSNNVSNNRRDSNATLKLDLPPTYEEVMRNLEETRETNEPPTTPAEPRSHQVVEIPVSN